jgi:hypothetical protein
MMCATMKIMRIVKGSESENSPAGKLDSDRESNKRESRLRLKIRNILLNNV